ERVAEPILERPGVLLPVFGVDDPGPVIADVRPRADERDPGHQYVNVAVGRVDSGDPLGHPARIQAPARAGQLLVDLAEQVDVTVEQQLAKVGDLADLPQQLDRLATDRAGANLL